MAVLKRVFSQPLGSTIVLSENITARRSTDVGHVLLIHVTRLSSTFLHHIDVLRNSSIKFYFKVLLLFTRPL